jgi:hypothetical protein
MGALRRLALLAILVSVAFLAACDTRAQPAAAAVGGGPVMDPERLSKELETCSRTADCAEGLRCFDEECRRTDRNMQGDYLAALAADSAGVGKVDAALDQYAAAAKAYDGKPPVDIDCAYGGALVDARADKEKAELAARVLHRCVQVAPAGSPLRDAALRQIALLDENGFDPAHLDKNEPADVYLSRAAKAPEKTELTLDVKASPEPTAKTWPPTLAAIQGAKSALEACWKANNAATKAEALAVSLPVKTQYHDSGYDDEPGYVTIQLDPKAAPAASPGEQCVRDAVTAAVKGVKGGGGEWTATVVVTVQ